MGLGRPRHSRVGFMATESSSAPREYLSVRVSPISPGAIIGSSGGLVLRYARDDDSDAIIALVSRVWSEYPGKTLVAATERLAQDLDGQSCVARPLTADELAEVDSAVLADLEPTWSRPGWRHLKHFNGFAASFWLTPSDITTETLEGLLLPEVGAAVLTIRLHTSSVRPQLSAWVRYHSERRLPRKVSSGLNRLTGRKLPLEKLREISQNIEAQIIRVPTGAQAYGPA